MKRVKTKHKNLFLAENGSYYYRRGNFDKSLGKISEAEAVRKMKGVILSQDVFGKSAMRTRLKEVFGEYVESRLLDVKNGEIRKTTWIDQNELWERHLTQFFGKLRFVQVDESMWDKYCKVKSGYNLAHHRATFSHFMKWAKRAGYTRYVLDMKIPAYKSRVRKRLTKAQMEAILGNAKGDLLLFIEMYLFMGMRRSEIRKLNWAQIDMVRRFIKLEPEHVKTKKGRIVTINRFVFEELERRRDGKSPWVFPHRDDPKRHGDPGGLKGSWQTCLKRAGLAGSGLTWHDLRATHQSFSNASTAFTDAQREKFSGSNIDVQKKHYANLNPDEVRGLESVVTFDGIDEILTQSHAKSRGRDLNKKMTPSTKSRSSK